MKFWTMEEIELIENKLNDFTTAIKNSPIKYNDDGESGTILPDNLSEIFKMIIYECENNACSTKNKESNTTKEDVYETMYDAIDKSMEWGFECDGNEYIHFIEGVKSMTKKLIDKMDSKNDFDSMRGETC